MKFLQWFLGIVVILGVCWVAGRMIFPVPSTEGRAPELAIPFDPDTPLGAGAAQAQAAHPGKSGVMPLGEPVPAFTSRVYLAQGAQSSLDVMYYIWHDDLSGLLLLEALRDAANRGVRVRLLLDDNGIGGLDPILAAMNQLPNFSVRLFNPSTIRSPKMAGYALTPIRINRRMHNKAFIADSAAAIVGGRNIGDEYFALGDVPAYLDLDVLGVGKVVSDTSLIFDSYWNSQPVIALEQVIKGPGDMALFDEKLAKAKAEPDAATLAADAQSPTEWMRDAGARLEWTDVQVVADDPIKGTGGARRQDLMISQLGSILGEVTQNVDLISAYFVPGKQGTAYFADLARKGHRVEILTNSWEATDVPTVHAGYIKYRRELLEAGVTLLELRQVDGQPQGRDELGPIGSNGASLHAKTFSIDDRRVFIGSFNFDPRSARLNCEMGFLIDSPALAQSGRGTLQDLARRSYQPKLDGKDMVWQVVDADGSVSMVDREPGLGTWDRIMVYVLNVLPIEWLL